jgi:signal peptidase I
MSDPNPYVAPVPAPRPDWAAPEEPKLAPRWVAVVVAILTQCLPGTGLLLLGRTKPARIWMATGVSAFLLGALQLAPWLTMGGVALNVLLWIGGVVATLVVRRGGLTMRLPVWALALALVLGAQGVSLCLRAFVCEAFQIPSGAMIPTLMIGDHLFVRKWQKTPARGDVIVFKYPHDPRVDYIKRVMALPGETITIHKNEVLVDGRGLPRRELIAPCPDRSPCQVIEESAGGHTYHVLHLPDHLTEFGPVKVPPGNYFVMGDNRDNSNDSRVWGTVPAENVKGVATVVWFSRDPVTGTFHWDRMGEPIR